MTFRRLYPHHRPFATARRRFPASYFDSGNRSSFKVIPNSSRSGFSSCKYCSYWPLFSTFALIPYPAISPHPKHSCPQDHIPSKTRTAVGKSFTLLAAFSAAVRTEGEGTRSYAKELFRLRCPSKISYDQPIADSLEAAVSRKTAATAQTDSTEESSIPEAQRHLAPGRTPSHI